MIANMDHAGLYVRRSSFCVSWQLIQQCLLMSLYAAYTSLLRNWHRRVLLWQLLPVLSGAFSAYPADFQPWHRRPAACWRSMITRLNGLSNLPGHSLREL